MTSTTQQVVDVNIPRFNQAMVALLTGLGFVAGWWPAVILAWVGVSMNRLVGPRWGPFTRMYTRWVRPRLTGEPATEWAAPPRFSQLLAVLFLGAASLLFVAGQATAGWTVTLVVTALATLAATARICVGCILYEFAVSR